MIWMIYRCPKGLNKPLSPIPRRKTPTWHLCMKPTLFRNQSRQWKSEKTALRKRKQRNSKQKSIQKPSIRTRRKAQVAYAPLAICEKTTHPTIEGVENLQDATSLTPRKHHTTQRWTTAYQLRNHSLEKKLEKKLVACLIHSKQTQTEIQDFTIRNNQD